MLSLEEISKSLKGKGKYWIAFVGDSITSCEWVHPNWRDIVQYVLQEEITDFLEGDWKTSEWGIKGFNFGYDGATTKDILDKVNEVKTVRPDLVILMIGDNDSLFGISIDEHIKNIRDFEKNFDNIVTSTDNCPYNSQAEKKYFPFVEADIRAKFNNFVDLFRISKEFPSDRIYTFKSEENREANIKEGDPDFWHPNQLGNAYIAKVVLKEVFGIEFDPELYMKTTLSGEKYPKY